MSTHDDRWSDLRRDEHLLRRGRQVLAHLRSLNEGVAIESALLPSADVREALIGIGTQAFVDLDGCDALITAVETGRSDLLTGRLSSLIHELERELDHDERGIAVER